jgi:hypothetical protein
MLADMGVNVINEEIAQGKNNEGFDRYFAFAMGIYPTVFYRPFIGHPAKQRDWSYTA